MNSWLMERDNLFYWPGRQKEVLTHRGAGQSFHLRLAGLWPGIHRVLDAYQQDMWNKEHGTQGSALHSIHSHTDSIWMQIES